MKPRTTNPMEFPMVSNAQDYRTLLRLFRINCSSGSSQTRGEQLCETAAGISNSDSAALYLFPKKSTNKNGGRATWLTFSAGRGGTALPRRIPATGSCMEILLDNDRAAVQLTPKGPFPELLIDPSSVSALAIYTETSPGERGILVLNSRLPYHYSGTHIELIEELAALIRANRGGD